MTQDYTDEVEVEELDEGFILNLAYEAITDCPNQDSAQYQCLECQLDLDDCTCMLDWETVTMDVYCSVCEKNHTNISVEALLANEIDFTSTPEPKQPTAPRYSYYNKCRHYNVPLEFPDGTVVHASSKHNRKPDEVAPDFGLYLDSSWKPACPAYLVTWIDYGLPVYKEAAAKAIIDVYNKARGGLWVEVGCIGGHGRTGTALACMAVLAGLKPAAAIKFVRENYCDHTIETKSQEWFVRWFAAYVNGGKSPQYVEKAWHKDDPDTVYPSEDFKTPIGWEYFDVTDNPQGTPPAEICETVRDEYVTVSWNDEAGKHQTVHIEPKDKDFERFYGLAMEQRKNPPKDDVDPTSGIALLKDLIGVQDELEPF